MSSTNHSLKLAIISGEESGDQLGAELVDELNRRLEKNAVQLQLIGLGGERLEQRGLDSFFAISEVSVMGISAVLARLPRIYWLAKKLIQYIIDERPDLLIIIDSPDLTHPVARRIRRKLPNLPVVNYVSPSVWAWRSKRAVKMKAYIDHVLALLPFEPDVYQRLQGPPCTYVGHPLEQKIRRVRAQIGNDNVTEPKNLLLMPGSRNSEVGRLLAPFGRAIELLKHDQPDLVVDIPAVAHLEDKIRESVQDWSFRPNIVTGETEKFLAFSRAKFALVASGTATLELALWGVPMVVGYKLDPIARRLKWLGQVDSIVLPNIVLGENFVPEFIDADCNPENLKAALEKLSVDPSHQISGFSRLNARFLDETTGSASRAVETLIQNGFISIV